MCDFCRYKKKIIDGKGNSVLFGAENNMMFDNSDGKEIAGVVKINFALSAAESWWKNETSKRIAHLRQVRCRNKSKTNK